MRVYTVLVLTVFFLISTLNCKINAEKTGEGEPVQISGAQRSDRGPGPDYAAYVFVFLDAIIISIWIN